MKYFVGTEDENAQYERDDIRSVRQCRQDLFKPSKVAHVEDAADIVSLRNDSEAEKLRLCLLFVWLR
jgi:hypothetical protein